jgi:hypothetical protein
MKIHLNASSATNNSMPDLIRHPGGEVVGYRLPYRGTGQVSPVWIQNAIFEVIPHAACQRHHEGRKYVVMLESRFSFFAIGTKHPVAG